ncbi:DUF1120 domain-containing protein [Pseudomonas kairouanensis]|uniref:DUF1120 domain-containing protein n=1 Tax=Pseudomonas kairouanensis TaxID=2293832 RepID=A0A4Z0B2H7_9PSED|nr:DUF1120 domain-containing protein [Pseudomonas kairouanensis]TFY92629.1 DUF1120 domain-containing protein [Pseudomonas kairouanensis]
MDKITPATLALVLAACAPGAFAASSTDVSLSGSITPSACDTRLTDGGVVDYGKLAARDLEPNKPHQLPLADMQVEVNCEGQTFFTLTTVDNRAGTSAINPAHHGLGVVGNDQKLGSVALVLLDPVADGVTVNVINSSNGGATWFPSAYLGHERLASFATAGGPNTPVAIKDLSARLRAFSILVPAAQLPLLDEVPIDGSATLVVKYL